MNDPDVLVAIGLAAYGAACYLLGERVGIRVERRRHRHSRPGYLPLAVYDWTRPDPPDAPIPDVALLGPTAVATHAGISAVQEALDRDDLHSRKVPDGDIRTAERRYETWLETIKDHGP